jgi:hypothetical protein
MLSQFQVSHCPESVMEVGNLTSPPKLNTLTIDDPIAALRLSNIGVGSNNMLQ